MSNKLTNLPSINFISVEDSVDRRKNLIKQFVTYGIKNFTPHVYKRRSEYDYKITGSNVENLGKFDNGPTTSHLNTIRKWYETTTEPYTIICEDDVSFETVKYWTFNWSDFFNLLPADWRCVQLVIIAEHRYKNFKFKPRDPYDWCAAAYLISRQHAKFLIEKFCDVNDPDAFTLDMGGILPTTEAILFQHKGVYSFPLLVEDVNNTSSTRDDAKDLKVVLGQRENHYESYNDVITWWKNFGSKTKIEKIMQKQINHIYQNECFGENWFSYPNLYKNAVRNAPAEAIFVEVGCWKGKSSAFLATEIANSIKNIDLYCVDTWEGSIEHQNRPDLKHLYKTFMTNMNPLKEYFIPLKTPSLEAAELFDNESLDFVFIDASHEYEDVKNDIRAWLPKIKPGGVLAGHDYYVDGHDYFPGVKKAVNETLACVEASENCWIFKKDETSIIEEFLSDVEDPEKNFLLGEWYENQKHYAPAHLYYLRCAEKSTNKELSYKALIRASFCYKNQGSRDNTEKVLLENAIVEMPNRPEAYYFLSLLYERRKDWQNSYIYAQLGINNINNRDLFTVNEYTNEYMLFFQKAVAAWWWGKVEESKELFLFIMNNYKNVIDPLHKKRIENNLKENF